MKLLRYLIILLTLVLSGYCYAAETGVVIYADASLTASGWANIDAGFDGADITTWDIIDNKAALLQPRTCAMTTNGTATIPAEAAFSD